MNLRIDSHDTIVDHTWIWRADHGAGVGWTANLSANAAQLLLDAFIAAVHVVDAIQNGLPVGHQRGQHQRSRGAQVRAHYRSRGQWCWALYRGHAAFHAAGCRPGGEP